jgi:hypothetical protein
MVNDQQNTTVSLVCAYMLSLYSKNVLTSCQFIYTDYFLYCFALTCICTVLGLCIHIITLLNFMLNICQLYFFRLFALFFLLFCFVLICVCTVLCLCIRIVTLLNSLFGHGHAWCLSYICCEKMRYKIWVRVMVFNATFNNYLSYIVAVSFIGGGNQSALSKPSTCHKSLTICMS